MIAKIFIRNYALIDAVTFEPNSKFTTITGETGAGKSVIMSALNLIQGKRADVSVLKDNSKKAIIEVTLNLKSSESFDAFFAQHELDFDEQTIIRREILPSGKSRAFVNDTPVTLAVLQEFTGDLIDVHSQFETAKLNDTATQFAILDEFAQTKELATDFAQHFKQYQHLKKQAEQLESAYRKALTDQDYLNFQFNELAELNLQANENEQLESELETLNSAEAIKSSYFKVAGILNDSELSVVQQLNDVQHELKQFNHLGGPYAELYSRVKSSLIELEDVYNEVESLKDSVEFDDARIQYVSSRLNKINDLLFKHNCSNTEELLQLQNELQEKLLSIESSDDELKTIQKQITQSEQQLKDKGHQLFVARKAQIPALEAQLKQLLSEMGMPNNQSVVELTALTELNKFGNANIQFKFSANKGMGPQVLSKVASGGELSRIMLALKYVLSQSPTQQCYVFDEIDTGVSGDIAESMGRIMQSIAQNNQVISITHLPQVAALGTEQFKVYKQSDEDSTITQVKALSAEERVLEIAKMLSGAKITEAARMQAEELLNIN